MKRWISLLLLTCVIAFAPQARAYTVSGTVTGGQPTITMLKYVVAIPMRLDTALHFAIVIPFLNSYSISNLDSGGYIIFAYQNVTSNPIPIPALSDPRGFYGGPVPQIFDLLGDSSGVTIALSEPNTAGFSGRTSYDGRQTGTTLIIASYHADFDSIHSIGVLLGSITAGQLFNNTGNGTYTALADSFTSYYVKAFMDLNGNFRQDDGEPVGIFGGDSARPITITSTNFPDSVNIVMHDPSAANERRVVSTVDFNLGSAYPNPFNSEAVIPFDLKKAADVELAVYDMTGRLARMLTCGGYAAGTHTVHFAAGNLSSGLYVVRLQSAGQTVARTLVLIR